MWLLDKFLIAFACLPPIHLLWFSISAEQPGLCTARPALWKLGLEMSRVVGCSHLSPRLCSYNYLTYLHGVSGLRSCGGNVVPCGAGVSGVRLHCLQPWWWKRNRHLGQAQGQVHAPQSRTYSSLLQPVSVPEISRDLSMFLFQSLTGFSHFSPKRIFG